MRINVRRRKRRSHRGGHRKTHSSTHNWSIERTRFSTHPLSGRRCATGDREWHCLVLDERRCGRTNGNSSSMKGFEAKAFSPKFFKFTFPVTSVLRSFFTQTALVCSNALEHVMSLPFESGTVLREHSL
jgi:hypothetical protein